MPRVREGVLTVTLESGHDLVAADVGGKSDPFCLLTVGSQELKSKIHKKTLNPKFNETFTLNVTDSTTESLDIRVYDWDRQDDEGNYRELHTEEAIDAIDSKAQYS